LRRSQELDFGLPFLNRTCAPSCWFTDWPGYQVTLSTIHSSSKEARLFGIGFKLGMEHLNYRMSILYYTGSSTARGWRRRGLLLAQRKNHRENRRLPRTWSSCGCRRRGLLLAQRKNHREHRQLPKTLSRSSLNTS